MIRQFSRYFSIGILNTLLHWGTFYTIYFLTGIQSFSNLIGFCIAVVFSFFMNAKFTFKQKTSSGKLIGFTIFMGGLSYLMGLVSDKMKLSPILTLAVFSGTSLILGFLYSKFIVFKEEK